MQRLGRDNDVKDVISHPWFKAINIEHLLAKKIPAPYMPKLKSLDDISNFDEKFQQLEVMESIIEPQKVQLIEQHNEAFSSF
mmetsp:Transcript_41067/g.30208  ORF Transcript_41067/g.30208 Transcript_41067/m.30208 type:complete len:82 (+) Transcript_41067:1412-1657(+)